jgi:UDP-N-acetylglucosamine 2-epimerase (non-hydrolysing)
MAAQKRLTFVLGTRPELIKLAPVVLEARRHPELRIRVLSSGQHRDLLKPLAGHFGIQFDHDLSLMRPGSDLASLTARTVAAIAEDLQAHPADHVVVQGDTTTAQAAALSAVLSRCKVAHVEAGLRTFNIDSPFPEELNRKLIAVCSNLHFCPTEAAARNLAKEGITGPRVLVTGNTGIDALLWTRAKETSKLNVPAELKSLLLGRRYIMVTLHRRESFGPEIRRCLSALVALASAHPVDFVFPAHPNPEVRSAIDDVLAPSGVASWTGQQGLELSRSKAGHIHICEPIDYPAMVALLSESEFVMTDSGGLQEEAPSFGLRVMVLRETTERPEAVEAGFSVVIGTSPEAIIKKAEQWIALGPRPRLGHPNPFGDGLASQRICEVLARPDCQ